MFSALTATLGQLTDPRLRNPVLVSVVVSVIVILLLGIAAWHIFGLFGFFGGWLDDIAAWIAGLAVVISGILFFPAASNAISGLFLESVSTAVEAKHYPGLGPARQQPAPEAILEAARFLGITILVNLLLLPVYIFAPGLNLLIFYSANGYLLGREYFSMIAARRLGAAEARQLRKHKSGAIFMSGVLIAAIMTVPVLNLAGPVIATAFMLHRFEGLRNSMKK